MPFDVIPVWAALLLTIGLNFLSVETGIRVGKDVSVEAENGSWGRA
jgi:hypothetical protein